MVLKRVRKFVYLVKHMHFKIKNETYFILTVEKLQNL